MEGKFTPRMRDERGHDHFPTGPGHHRIRLGVQYCVQRHGGSFDRDGKLRPGSTSHVGVLVGGVVVQDEMDLEILGDLAVEATQELQELLVTVPGQTLAHLSGEHVERSGTVWPENCWTAKLVNDTSGSAPQADL